MNTSKYIALAGAALLLPLTFSCSKSSEEPKADTKQNFVMTDTMYDKSTFATASEEYAQNEIRLFGKVSAENNNISQVFPTVGGSVIEIKAELGDYVTQGQLLASIRSTEIAGFQSQSSDAEADVSIAERNLQSVKDLYEGKLASEKELVMAQKELDKAKAEQNRMSEVNQIYKLKKGSVYHLYAPISGYIVSKDISPNEMLSPNRDEAVFTVAKLDNVWVLANVNESDLDRIKTGQDATIHTIAYPDRKIKGKIDKIFNVIDPETRAAKALIKIPNADVALKPEMNATVKIRFPDDKKYVTVPSASVVFDNNRNYVMVFNAKDNIETREVSIFKALDDKTYISSGLKEGEKVIVKGNLLIYDAIND